MSLLGELPEAGQFPSETLALPSGNAVLNFHQKLGYLYEDALATMLESTPRYEVLAKGLQIRDETGRTLGELDFLLRDSVTARLIHLELAVKFYLAIQTNDELLLPGPDARDNYFRKLDKMRSHQLQLAQKFQHLLPEEFRSKKIDVQHLVQGCIFQHISSTKPIDAAFLNPNGRRGKWLHASECEGYFGSKPTLEIIPKALWPVPLPQLKEITLAPWHWEQMESRCLMVRTPQSDVPHFIAPDDYPIMDRL